MKKLRLSLWGLLLPLAALLIQCTQQVPHEAITGEGITGRVDRYASFESAFLKARNVDVWVPAGYEDSKKMKYAVVYVHDGQNLYDPAASYIGVDWGIDETMTRLIGEGMIQKAIVVGVWNTELRVPEYMPETVVMQQPDSVQAGFRNMFDSEPLADEYLEFLVKELKPFIDKQYRTKTDASHTFIMGSSMGGLISMYALAEFPEVFGGAGCLSTHWPIGNGACVDYWADHLPEPGSNRIYFDYGTATLDSLYEPYQVRVDQIMQDAGYTPDIDWITRKYEGDDHSERSWNRRVHVPLTFFLKVEE